MSEPTRKITSVSLGPNLSRGFEAMVQTFRTARAQEVIRQGFADHENDLLLSLSALFPPVPTPFELILDKSDVGFEITARHADQQEATAHIPLKMLMPFMRRYWANLQPFTEEKLPTNNIRQLFEEARHNTHLEAGSQLMQELVKQGFDCSLPVGESLFCFFVYTFPDEMQNPSAAAHVRSMEP